MSTIDAWRWIIEHWSCVSWTPIDSTVRTILHIDPSRGMCNGVICTRKSSQGMDELIRRINSHKEN